MKAGFAIEIRTYLYFLLLLLIGCGKEQDRVDTCAEEFLTVIYNDSIRSDEFEYSASIERSLVDSSQWLFDLLVFRSKIDFRGLPEFYEELAFLFIPFKVGTYELSELSIYNRLFGNYGHIVLQDIAGHDFGLMNGLKNTIVIEHIDLENQIVTGQFQAHFELIEEKTGVEYDFVEQVHFTMSEFCISYEIE